MVKLIIFSFFVSFQVVQFFDQDYTPLKCLCGESVTFNVAAAISFVKEKCNTVEIPSVTAHSIRFFIKSNNIGHVGLQVRFRNKEKQSHAVHDQTVWFDPEDIKTLDESK